MRAASAKLWAICASAAPRMTRAWRSRSARFCRLMASCSATGTVTSRISTDLASIPQSDRQPDQQRAGPDETTERDNKSSHGDEYEGDSQQDRIRGHREGQIYTQFSVRRPGMRSNSRRLLVTTIRPALRACAPISMSCGPAGQPTRSNSALTWP